MTFNRGEVIPMNRNIIKNSQFSVEVRAVKELLVSLKPDEVATYETMSQRAGKDVRPGQKGYTILNQARRRAANEANVLTTTLIGTGLRRLSSEEVATVDNDRERRLLGRKMRKSVKRLKCADDTELSNDAKMKKYGALATYGAMEMFRGNPRTAQQLAEKSSGEVPLSKLLEAFK